MSNFLGFGTALADHVLEPQQGMSALSAIWPRLRGVEAAEVTRYLVQPVEETFRERPLGERMRVYQREAPRLARLAAERALDSAGIGPTEVDLVISASCTGYMVPSLDVGLINQMGLRRDILRLPLTEMGCSGGGAALAAAHRHLSSRPGDRVLVVCVELCSLTFQPGDHSIDNLTAAMVFGDGAAATVLGGGVGGLEVVDAGSWLLAGSEGLLGFELGDGGFSPILDRQLPRLIKAELPAALAQFGSGPGEFQAVHAGGPRIFDAAEGAMGLAPGGLAVSREVFRRYGNLSSASLLFVLEALPEVYGEGLALAFGPGVSLEMARLRRTPG